MEFAAVAPVLLAIVVGLMEMTRVYNVQNTLESFFPGFSDLVLQREVVTPLDIEQVAGLPEGNIFHGEMLAPQTYFFRPAPGWNQYRTPIDNLYMCGSATHPGGGIMGAPGRNGALKILADRRS